MTTVWVRRQDGLVLSGSYEGLDLLRRLVDLATGQWPGVLDWGVGQPPAFTHREDRP